MELFDVVGVDGVFVGALGVLGDDNCGCGDGVLTSWVRSMKSALGGIMVIFGLLEGMLVE